MAVIMAPSRNNNYSLNLGGILTSLVGSQIGAMFERAQKAKQVEAERAVVGALNGGQGMNTEQMLQAALSHPSAGKVGADFFKNFNLWAAERGKNLGKQEYTEGMVGSGFTPEQAKTVTGGSDFLDSANLLAAQDRVIPKLVNNTVDTGGAQQFFQTNPYMPGIVQGTTQSFEKTNDPDKLLQADVSMKGYESQERVAGINAAANKYSADARNLPGLIPVKLPDGSISMVRPQAGMKLPGEPIGGKSLGDSGTEGILAQISAIQTMAEQYRNSDSPNAQSIAAVLDNQAAGLVLQLTGQKQNPQPQAPQKPNREALIADMVANGADPAQAAAIVDEKLGKI